MFLLPTAELIRDFLWGSTPGKRKLHLVNWNKLTLANDLECLTILKMRARNLAMLAKLCWRLAFEQEAP